MFKGLFAAVVKGGGEASGLALENKSGAGEQKTAASRDETEEDCSMKVNAARPATAETGADHHRFIGLEEQILLEQIERQNALLEAQSREARCPSPLLSATAANATLQKPRQSSPSSSKGSVGGRGLFRLTKLLGGDRDSDTDGTKPHERHSQPETAPVTDQDLLALWGELTSEWDSKPQVAHQKARELIAKEGVPDPLRGMVWQLLADTYRSPEKEAYPELLSVESPFERQIEKDIARTFPEHAFFNDHAGMGQETLFRVVKAVSLHDPDMGYCQGMAFIVGLFLMKMPEEDAFALLLALMNKYKMRELFMPGMPLLGVAHYQFRALLRHYLPEVSLCVEREGVQPSSYLTQWLMTLFAVALPLPMVFYAVDVVLAFGNDTPTGALEVLYSLALALLFDCAEDIVTGTLDGIMNFLRVDMCKAYEVRDSENETDCVGVRARKVLAEAMSIHIPSRMLDQLKRDFAAEKAIEDFRQGRIRELLTTRDTLEQSVRVLQLSNDRIRERIAAEQVQTKVALAKMERRCAAYDRELVTLKKQHRMLLRMAESRMGHSSTVSIDTLDYCRRPSVDATDWCRRSSTRSVHGHGRGAGLGVVQDASAVYNSTADPA